MKKYSRKRAAILNALCSTKTHPSAEWIYATLKPQYPDLSLATVYRNIAEFVREGTAVRVGVVDGHERYDGSTQPHAHFICDGCGQVLDIDCPIAPTLDQIVAQENHLEVQRHELTFRGRCSQCSHLSVGPDCCESKNID